MKLKKLGHNEYWELSQQELLRRQGAEVENLSVETDREYFSINDSPIWQNSRARALEINNHVSDQLAQNNMCIFSGKNVRMSSRLLSDARKTMKQFNHMGYPSFGAKGAEGFFAGRTLRSFESFLNPEEHTSEGLQVGFLTALIIETIRSLPDYDAERIYEFSWMFSRHSHPVQAMPFHQDRVGWLAQFNLNRSAGVKGGSIQLREVHSGSVAASSSLKGFLDGYIIRDDLFEHGTTGMTMENPGVDYRDVIVLRLPASES